MEKEKFVPEITTELRKNIIEVPRVISMASGIRILGKRIKSILFSTDVAIIKNINADAIIAVYPFTPQPSITQAILEVAPVPVFTGVGGGLTTGQRSINIALHAEFQGAIGVVLNAPTPNDVIREMRERIDIPIVVTVVSENDDIKGRIESGAAILNVSGGSKTVDILKRIRKVYPHFPVIATGGPTEESILETIEAGANAITYTPPSTAKIFSQIMNKYRGVGDM
ncbi:pentose-5-phosphate-3-epimerase [Anaerosolibacter carboniphilus]|uniref:Pentose-5-phosphate-3-epimerase n=1 Tax=Anaerosolibacter carboniphilus TaxID=1417629 RepID=A0A841KPP9_9FIRM|nr:hydrolase [Anaerosolibacter carboniphilus]MBB6215301.1 pentose-5-phosphate-3-epimerase [Anaerosolibacter carboniphilus]